MFVGWNHAEDLFDRAPDFVRGISVLIDLIFVDVNFRDGVKCSGKDACVRERGGTRGWVVRPGSPPLLLAWCLTSVRELDQAGKSASCGSQFVVSLVRARARAARKASIG